MSTNQKVFNDVTQFLESIAPAPVEKEIVKPFPESTLHEMTFEELKTNLYEARRVQHLLPQFSAAEAQHFKFVDEATAVLAYKQLDELKKSTLGSYIKKAADSGMDQSYKAGGAVLNRPEDSKKHAAKSLNRFKGILRATAKLTKEEVEPLDELSRATLNAYSGKSTEEVGNYEKDHNAKMSTIAKRIKGVLVARKKLKTKNKETVLDESEQLNELGKTTLGSYVKKAAASAIDNTEEKWKLAVKKDVATKHDAGKVEAWYKPKTDKRTAGISKAVSKMTEEVDHSNRQLFEDAAAAAETDARFKIVRMYNKGERSHTIKRGLSLADAKSHCSNPETSSMTATLKSNIERTQRMGHWFDGYDYDK